MAQTVFIKGEQFFMDYTPAADLAAGEVKVLGKTPCICNLPAGFTYDSSRPTRMVALAVRGGIYLCTADGAIPVRTKVFWDDTNNKVTLTEAGNYHFGYTCGTAAANDGDLIPVEHNPNGMPGPTVLGVAGSYKVARGSSALDGSNPTSIATGLTTIVAAVATLKGTSAPGDNTSILSVNYTGSDGQLDVYAWKNTGGTDPTLVASTGTENFDWIAIGT